MIRRPYLLGGALVLGLAGATAARFAVVPAVMLAALGAVLRPRLWLACVLAVGGWWWGSERLHALDRSVLARYVDTASRALVVRWAGVRVHEPVLLELPGSRAPPQGSRLRVLGTLRRPRDFERTWLRRHGVHVVLRASAWRRVATRGGLADRLHAWLSRASTPGLTGERRAVLQGVVLGEDGGLSDTLRQRFRASGLYHLLAVSGGNVLVVAGGTVGLALLLGVSRLLAETAALVAISG